MTATHEEGLSFEVFAAKMEKEEHIKCEFNMEYLSIKNQ